MSGGIEEHLARLLVKHEGPIFMDGQGTFQCECGFDCSEPCTIPPEELWATKNWASHVAAVLAEAIQPPVIETLEQLDALPVGTVISMGGHGLYEKDAKGDWGFPPDHPTYLLDEAAAFGLQVRAVYVSAGGLKPTNEEQQ